MARPPVRQLRQVIDAIAAAMDADGMGVTHLVGSEHLTTEEATGFRYVWIPTSDKYEAPYLGGEYGYDGGPSNPRALFSRLMGVEVHCWGIVEPPDDAGDPDVYFDAGDLLAQNLLVYLRRVAAADFVVNGGVWLDSKDRTTGKYGRVYVLGLGIYAPTPDQTYTLAQIRQIVIDLYMRDPAGDDGDGELGAEITIQAP